MSLWKIKPFFGGDERSDAAKEQAMQWATSEPESLQWDRYLIELLIYPTSGISGNTYGIPVYFWTNHSKHPAEGDPHWFAGKDWTDEKFQEELVKKMLVPNTLFKFIDYSYDYYGLDDPNVYKTDRGGDMTRYLKELRQRVMQVGWRVDSGVAYLCIPSGLERSTIFNKTAVVKNLNKILKRKTPQAQFLINWNQRMPIVTGPVRIPFSAEGLGSPHGISQDKYCWDYTHDEWLEIVRLELLNHVSDTFWHSDAPRQTSHSTMLKLNARVGPLRCGLDILLWLNNNTDKIIFTTPDASINTYDAFVDSLKTWTDPATPVSKVNWTMHPQYVEDTIKSLREDGIFGNLQHLGSEISALGGNWRITPARIEQTHFQVWLRLWIKLSSGALDTAMENWLEENKSYQFMIRFLSPEIFPLEKIHNFAPCTVSTIDSFYNNTIQYVLQKFNLYGDGGLANVPWERPSGPQSGNKMTNPTNKSYLKWTINRTFGKPYNHNVGANNLSAYARYQYKYLNPLVCVKFLEIHKQDNNWIRNHRVLQGKHPPDYQQKFNVRLDTNEFSHLLTPQIAEGVDILSGKQFTLKDELVGLHTPVVWNRIPNITFDDEFLKYFIMQATTQQNYNEAEEAAAPWREKIYADKGEIDLVRRGENGELLTEKELFPNFEELFKENEIWALIYNFYTLEYYMENEGGKFNQQGYCGHITGINDPCKAFCLAGADGEDYYFDDHGDFFCEAHVVTVYDDLDLGDAYPLMYAADRVEEIRKEDY